MSDDGDLDGPDLDGPDLDGDTFDDDEFEDSEFPSGEFDDEAATDIVGDGGDVPDDSDSDSDSGVGGVFRKRRVRGTAGRGTAGRGSARRGRRRGPARKPISGMRVLAGTIATFVVVVALFAVAYFTPLMSVRTVSVTGNSVVSAEEITSAAAIPAGEPLLQVDAATAAQRVSMIPRVASVRVKREYPSTINITVVERVAVVFTERDGQKYLMDKLGFEFAQQDPPPGLAQLRTQNPGSGDPSTRAALAVITEVPPYVAEQIAAIEVSSPVNIVLVLKDNRTVVWGDDSRNAEKSETLRHVLTQEGTEYNVSSPSNPTFK